MNSYLSSACRFALAKNLAVFDDTELEMIITAASLLSEILRKSQSFHTKREMYEKFDEWRHIVNLQCSAYNELKHRTEKPTETIKILSKLGRQPLLLPCYIY